MYLILSDQVHDWSSQMDLLAQYADYTFRESSASVLYDEQSLLVTGGVDTNEKCPKQAESHFLSILSLPKSYGPDPCKLRGKVMLLLESMTTMTSWLPYLKSWRDQESEMACIDCGNIEFSLPWIHYQSLWNLLSQRGLVQ